MKLRMENLQVVKLAAMVGSLVLFSQGSNVHVGAPISMIKWWDDTLEEIKP
jgi:hypothetical protein